MNGGPAIQSPSNDSYVRVYDLYKESLHDRALRISCTQLAGSRTWIYKMPHYKLSRVGFKQSRGSRMLCWQHSRAQDLDWTIPALIELCIYVH
jgi:hypothetical protein